MAVGLEALEAADASVQGTLDAGFIAGQGGDGAGAIAIEAEGAGPEVRGIEYVRRGRGGLAAIGSILLILGVDALAVGILFGDGLEAFAVEGGFHGEDGVEAPLTGGHAQDEFLFDFADGLKAIDEVLEKEQEVGGVVIKDEVFVGAQSVDETIAAGFGFAFGRAGAGRFLCIAAIGFDSGLAGLVRGFFHCVVPFASMVWRRDGGDWADSGQAFERTGAGFFGGM